VPAADAYALPLDGSEATIDGARVMSQPTARVSVRPASGDSPGGEALDHLSFGSDGAAATLRARLVPVDRFGNPTDPPPGYAVVIDSDAALEVVGQRGSRRGRPVPIRRAKGRLLLARLARRTPDGSRGALRIEREGVVVASLPYTVDAAIRQHKPDLTVPSRTAPTIQAAIAAATDRNHDGVIAISVRPGLYREAVVIDRAIELSGGGDDLSLIQGDGTGTAVDIAAPGAVVQRLGTVGAGTGFRLAGSGAQLRASSAWRSVAVGIDLTASHGVARDVVARENGGAGVRIGAAATAAACADAALRANFGAGLSVAAAADVQLDGNVATQNNAGGVVLNGAAAPTARGNRLVANVGSGLAALRAGAVTAADNLVALNDEDGMQFDRCDDALVTGNTIVDNNGTGLFFRRGANGDFGAAPGAQSPPGDNVITGNRKGDVEVRTD
jgi:parallel beta-helix repeat protein